MSQKVGGITERTKILSIYRYTEKGLRRQFEWGGGEGGNEAKI